MPVARIERVSGDHILQNLAIVGAVARRRVVPALAPDVFRRNREHGRAERARIAAGSCEDGRLQIEVTDGCMRQRDGLSRILRGLGGFHEHDGHARHLERVEGREPCAVVGRHDDGRIVVDAQVLEALQVIFDDVERTDRLLIRRRVAKAHVMRLLVHAVGIVGPDEVDEAERTAGIALLDRETKRCRRSKY